MGSCLQIATICFGHAEHYLIIYVCKRLKIFERVLMFNSNDPIKIAHLEK